MFEKYYNEKGQMGVLVSSGYGAGWSTWNDPDIAYDKRIVEAFINGTSQEEMEKLLTKCGYNDTYMGGFEDLKVEWVDKGYSCRINEYDGSESLEIFDSSDWVQA